MPEARTGLTLRISNMRRCREKAMKKLYIIRHAKSDWGDLSLNDYDRPLNKRGKKDAPMMGKILAEQGIRPDLILSSPACRALTTAQTIAEEVGYDDKNIVYQESLYLASPEEIENILRSLPSSAQTVFIIGHNPGLSEFAEYVCAEAIGNIPTCGIVELILNEETWQSIGKRSVTLASFDYPKKHKKVP